MRMPFLFAISFVCVLLTTQLPWEWQPSICSILVGAKMFGTREAQHHAALIFFFFLQQMCVRGMLRTVIGGVQKTRDISSSPGTGSHCLALPW